MLFVFDNFDNLITESSVIVDVLEQAPAVKILLTSRQRLNLQEEQIFPLEGLATPESVDDILQAV